jgi:hypothetical protein
MGWDLEKDTRASELDVARWGEDQPPEGGTRTGIDVFNLSGGVMRPGSRASNRIDGLLTKMIESPSSCKYIRDIDRNLDYLFTHLQLDMIERSSRDVSGAPEQEPEAAEQPEPVIALDRVRQSV